MGSLRQYTRKSPLMILKIRIEGELYVINLAKELKIDDDLINEDIKYQPKTYYLLGVIHSKLVKQVKSLEKQKDKEYGRLFVYFLTSRTSKFYLKNKYFPAQKVAEALVEHNKDYLKVIDQLHQAIENRDTIQKCLESFEQRFSLLQTLSSNLRKQL